MAPPPQQQQQYQRPQSVFYGYPSFPPGELPTYNSNSVQSREFTQDSISNNGFKDPSNGALFQAESNHPSGFDVRHGYTNSISPMKSHMRRTHPNVHSNLHEPHVNLHSSHGSYDAYRQSQPHPDSHHPHRQSQPHPDSHHPHRQSQPRPDSHNPHRQSHTQLQIPESQFHQHSSRQQHTNSHPNHPPQGAYSHNPCAQPRTQQQILCQEVTPQKDVLYRPTSSSYIQNSDANNIAVGVPVGRPIYMSNPYVISPPTMPPMQNNLSHWQTSYPQSAPILAAIPMDLQPSVSSFTSPQTCHQMNSKSNMLERQGCLDGKQYLNFQEFDQLQCNGSKANITQSCARNDIISSYKPETQLSVDVSIRSDNHGNVQHHDIPDTNVEIKRPICKLSNGNHEKQSKFGGKSPGSPMQIDHFRQKFPQKDSFASGRQFSSTQRNDRHLELQVRSHTNQPFSRRGQNERYYQKDNGGTHVNRFRGFHEDKYCESPINKGVGGRTTNRRPQQQLRCDPCERSFGNRGDFDAHLNFHVKCGEEGCTFEASGKIVKEHKVVEHGKTYAPTTAIGRKALALRLTEDKEEVARWRQERKNNYPTSANILQKAEQRKKREAAGIFFDEELQKRRLQMKEVLDRQRKLGFQAAEIPPKYIIPYDKERRQRPIRNVRDREHIIATKRPYSVVDAERPMDGEGNMEKTVDSSQKIADDNVPHRVNKQQNALRKEGLPKRKRRKQQRSCVSDDVQMQIRQPTLLSKLLERDIMKENSYLLQCCRFIVNNSFLQHASSTLKHLSWNIEPTNVTNNEIKMLENSSEDSLSREDIHTSADVSDSSPLLLREDLKDTNEDCNKVVIVQK